MDVLDLARWQFGITTVYHFLFVPITIGLCWLVAGMQTAWVRTGNEKWLRATKFFGKLFLINFAMGVVTGIVQEFQFGMNWSDYSRFVGDIFGAPLAIEGLLAFFLESTFLGLWIFGWDRLPKKLHLATIWIAAIGTLLSAYFILAANSFMQHPVGYGVNPVTGRAELHRLRRRADQQHVPSSPSPTRWPRRFMVAGALVAGISHLAPDASERGRRRGPLHRCSWAWSPPWSPAVARGHLRRHPRQDHDRAAAHEDGRRRGAVRDRAARAVLHLHHRHARRLRAGLLHRDPGAAVLPGHGRLRTARSRASTTCRRSTRQTYADTGLTDFAPNIPVTYWTFRLMIGVGHARRARRPVGRCGPTRRGPGARTASGAARAAIVVPLLPLIANQLRLDLHRDGPPAVDRLRPHADRGRGLPGGHARARSGSRWSASPPSTRVLAVVEVGLIIRTVRQGPPEAVDDPFVDREPTPR